MGGEPFSPPFTDWPSSMIENGTKKRPMAFIGQFNFAEIIYSVPELAGIVPNHGLLQLFYDIEEFPWGTYPQDLNYFRLIWYSDIENWSHEPMLAPVPSYPEKEFGLAFSYRPSFPESPDELDFPEDLFDLYLETLVYDEHHQIAGYPLPVQSDPMEELAEGDRFGDDTPWQLLLQIDSDERMGIMWSDTGTIYLGVKNRSLATADLSQALLILQCC